MPSQFDPDQVNEALGVIDQACASIVADLKNHQVVQQALQLIKTVVQNAIAPEEATPEGEDKPAKPKGDKPDA